MPEPLSNPLEAHTTKREREHEVAVEIGAKVFGTQVPSIRNNKLYFKIGEYYYTVEVKEAGKKVA